MYEEWALQSGYVNGERTLTRDWDGGKTRSFNASQDLYILKVPSIDGLPIPKGGGGWNETGVWTHHMFGKPEFRVIVGGPEGMSMKYQDPMHIYELDQTNGLAPIGLARARDAMDFYMEQNRGSFHIDTHNTGTIPAANYLRTIADETVYGGFSAEWDQNNYIIGNAVVFCGDNKPSGVPLPWDGIAEEEAHVNLRISDFRIPSPTDPSTTIYQGLRQALYPTMNVVNREAFSRAGTIFFYSAIEYPIGTKWWNAADHGK